MFYRRKARGLTESEPWNQLLEVVLGEIRGTIARLDEFRGHILKLAEKMPET